MKVFMLFNYDTLSLLCSLLIIFYITMLQSLIFDREVDFVALMMLMFVVSKTAFSCLMIIIHCAKKYVMKERCT